MTRPRILLVEDDPPVIRMLAQLLRTDGYEVETMLDGGAAISRLAHGERPGVLVIDYRLPHADGLAVASFARSRFPGLPVIVVTSWAELVEKSPVVLDPPAVILPKPLVYAELAAALVAATSAP